MAVARPGERPKGANRRCEGVAGGDSRQRRGWGGVRLCGAVGGTQRGSNEGGAGDSSTATRERQRPSEARSERAPPSRLGLWRSSPQKRRSHINNRQQHHSIAYKQPCHQFAIPTPAIDQAAGFSDPMRHAVRCLKTRASTEPKLPTDDRECWEACERQGAYLTRLRVGIRSLSALSTTERSASSAEH